MNSKERAPLTHWVSCIYRREEAAICPRPPEKYMIYTLGPWAFTISPFRLLGWAISPTHTCPTAPAPVNSSVIFPPFPFPAADARDEEGAADGGAGCAAEDAANRASRRPAGDARRGAAGDGAPARRRAAEEERSCEERRRRDAMCVCLGFGIRGWF